MRLLLTVAALLLLFRTSSAQNPETRPSFEVASVKPAPQPIATRDEYTEGYNAGMRAALASAGMRISGQRVNITDNSLKDLIRIAWQLKDYQVAGPSWMASSKFEIVANMPAGSDRSQAPAMLQALLESRFHLQWHMEKRQLPVYALVVVKGGAKLSPAAGPPNKRGGNAWIDSGVGHLRASNSPVAALADLLTKVADRPVIDATGLSEIYDFDLTYAGLTDTPSEAAPSLTAALASIGLRLEKRDVPMDVLVVDRAETVPTGN